MCNLQSLLEPRREQRLISFYPCIIMDMDLNSKGMGLCSRYAIFKNQHQQTHLISSSRLI